MAVSLLRPKLRHDRPLKVHSFTSLGEAEPRWHCVAECLTEQAARDWIARRAHGYTLRPLVVQQFKSYRLGEYEGSKLRREVARFSCSPSGVLTELQGRAL